MPGRARCRALRYCLFSLANFWNRRPSGRAKRDEERGTGLPRSRIYIRTNRQLGNPSRSRCRRCLRILAIFRLAASDKAARFFFLLPALYRYAPISHLFPGEKAKRERLGNGLRTAWRMENEFAYSGWYHRDTVQHNCVRPRSKSARGPRNVDVQCWKYSASHI